MNYFVILPNQLFDKKILNNKYFYIIWENPHYFKKYNNNKKKLILHRSSMKYYYDYLIKNNFKWKYLEFHQKMDINIYDIYDPIDNIKLHMFLIRTCLNHFQVLIRVTGSCFLLDKIRLKSVG